MASSKSNALETLMMTLALAMLATVAAAATSQLPLGPSTTTNLTLHNLYPFPVWPLVTANAGCPPSPPTTTATRSAAAVRQRPRHAGVPVRAMVGPRGRAYAGCADDYNDEALPVRDGRRRR
ncbi:hypothetical protein U9M48_000337 [Paspalum notatum var. saurae]|uniref:Uncharacterized protein n=1 Tax=Paspalum notatum var. saurae TaxID=547442 RepID=A0AAQ3PLA6_PASNO